ncbi:hypothetical protein [Paenibacillus herberti]|uniref:Copper amine oxidase-like N-terminal domain-containing protein n=1 Tax=Paenibacillus herberti TaxID=1619309 RepID=A0A229NXU8_9BACL|nr:hypothetical protein [Paenibacillus herberti]OXM14700.1 hypothetical protein CGZ75_17530 [Paenibacillus herberti]
MKQKVVLMFMAIMIMLPATVFAASDKFLSEEYSYTSLPEDIQVGDIVQIEFESLKGKSMNDLRILISDSSILEHTWNGDAGELVVEAVGEGQVEVTYSAEGYKDETISLNVVSELYEDEDSTTEEESVNEEAYPQEILDLQEYVSMLEPIEPYETKALSAYEKLGNISSSNRKSFYNTLTYSIIPNYTKVVSMSKLVVAPNDELKQIHSLVIKGSKLQLEGFQLAKTAIYKKTSFKAANAKFAAATKLLEQYNSEVIKYGNRYSSN